MIFKFIVISVLVYTVQGNKDYDGYIDCFKDFLNNFFGDNQETVVFKVNNKNKNITEVKDVNLTEVDRVLKDLSTLFNIGNDEQLEKKSELALFTNFENKTQIYVNIFEFDTDFANVALENLTNIDQNIDILEKNTTAIKEDEAKTIIKQILNKPIEIPVKNIKQNEIIIDDDLNFYEDHDDNSTDYPIIDYVDFYKDTTNEEYVYVPTESAILIDGKTDNIEENNIENNLIEATLISNDNISATLSSRLQENEEDVGIESIFPWIVTIFIKNDSMNQFSYYCDGALLDQRKIITAARCVNVSNSVLKPEDLLVVLGKSSLQQMASREKVTRINEIIIHENFVNDDDGVKNDLAILVMDEPILFTKYVNPTNISYEEDFKGIKDSATTAWAITGRLETVIFEKVEYVSCSNDVDVENAVCATYGYDVPLCPSYGGLLVVKRNDKWQLEGIMSGDPSKRGICYNKSVTYTYLENYLDWINNIIRNNI